MLTSSLHTHSGMVISQANKAPGGFSWRNVDELAAAREAKGRVVYREDGSSSPRSKASEEFKEVVG